VQVELPLQLTFDDLPVVMVQLAVEVQAAFALSPPRKSHLLVEHERLPFFCDCTLQVALWVQVALQLPVHEPLHVCAVHCSVQSPPLQLLLVKLQPSPGHSGRLPQLHAAAKASANAASANRWVIGSSVPG
jgi:hypothetical protein